MILRRTWDYLAGLSVGRFVLWCYFIWWAVVLVRYFYPSPRLWLTSLGLSLIIGLALSVNTTASGPSQVSLDPVANVPAVLNPFLRLQFRRLVKGRGFLLIFSLRIGETALALGLCGLLGVAAIVARRPAWRRASTANEPNWRGDVGLDWNTTYVRF